MMLKTGLSRPPCGLRAACHEPGLGLESQAGEGAGWAVYPSHGVEQHALEQGLGQRAYAC